MNVRRQIGGAVCVALLLAGCGASSSTTGAATTAGGSTSSVAASATTTTPSTTTPATTTPATTTPSTTSSGGATPPSSTQSLSKVSDPCAIMTSTDVQAEFGGTASAGALAPKAEGSQGPECDFQIAGSTLGQKATVYDVIDTTRTPADVKEDAQSGGTVAVPGIGDSAYYSANMGSNDVVFTKDGKVLDVGVVQQADSAGGYSPLPSNLQALLVALAKAVANRV
jgi:hypothetical protein